MEGRRNPSCYAPAAVGWFIAGGEDDEVRCGGAGHSGSFAGVGGARHRQAGVRRGHAHEQEKGRLRRQQEGARKTPKNVYALSITFPMRLRERPPTQPARSVQRHVLVGSQGHSRTSGMWRRTSAPDGFDEPPNFPCCLSDFVGVDQPARTETVQNFRQAGRR